MPKTKTTQEFIQDAVRKHGNKYDYSLVEYKRSNLKVKIICEIHGQFEQNPNNHIRGSVCYSCAKLQHSNIMRSKTEQFINKAIKIHGDRYDYSKVNYIVTNKPVSIICKKHGIFNQNPQIHLRGSHCQKCARKFTYKPEEWLFQAIKVHGDRYDYSKVEHKKGKEKICIICKIHGEFFLVRHKHIKEKQGCPSCGRISAGNKRRRSKDQFIKQSVKVHGDKYDYSSVEYISGKDKVNIICCTHGVFKQTPDNHINHKKGCSKCARCYQYTTAEWIDKAREIHGTRYNYSKVKYIDARTKVEIICSIHGSFFQTPDSHYCKQHGCQQCAIVQNANTLTYSCIEWVEKAQAIHENRYDYSKVNYESCHIGVCIICKIHGEFMINPAKHITAKQGCIQCSKINSGNLRRHTTEQFIEMAKKKHGDKYMYSLVEYKSIDDKVNILCKTHGSFLQIAYVHLQGSGCPSCSKSSVSKKQIEWLLSISIRIQHAHNGGEFRIPGTRFKADGYCKKTNTIYEFNGDFFHGNPKFYDPEKINPVSKIKYGKLFKKTLHREMIIRNLGYNYVSIWEYEFDEQFK